MKTTVEISDDILRRAKKLAQKKGTTLRELLEDGLRRVLQEESQAKESKLRDCSIEGEGLAEEYERAPWSNIRAAAYGDRE